MTSTDNMQIKFNSFPRFKIFTNFLLIIPETIGKYLIDFLLKTNAGLNRGQINKIGPLTFVTLKT